MSDDGTEQGSDTGLDALLQTAERLVAARSTEDVVEVLRATARNLVGAEGITVVLHEGDQCCYVAEDAVSPLWTGQSFPSASCVSGWAMRHGKTVVIEDVLLDDRVPQEAYTRTFVRSLVLVPIGRPKATAALGAYWAEPKRHAAHVIDKLESLGRLATLALENARLQKARDRAAKLGAVQSRVLELAVEEAPLPETLAAIVLEMEELANSGMLGSILLVDADGKHLRHGAAPSLPAAYNEVVDGIEIGPSVGSCGSAVCRNEPVFVSDIASDPLWMNYRDLAAEHGLAACWSIPIHAPSGAVLGTFAMYYRQQRSPSEADLEIVDFVVRTVGLVLQRAMTHAELLRGQARYRQIVEGADDFAIVTLDRHGLVTGWNAGAIQIVGYSREEIIGRPGAIIFTTEDREVGAPEAEMRRAGLEGRAQNERWHVRKDGSHFWGSGVTMPLAADHGGFLKIFRDRTLEHDVEEGLRESEGRLRFLAELDQQLFGAADAAAAMQTATRLLGQMLEVSRCAYADVDADGDRFWIRADYSAPGVSTSAGEYSLDLFGTRAAIGLRDGRVLVVCDVDRELAPGDGRDMFQSIGIQAIVCCPLIKDGRLTAMMAVHQNTPREWTSAELMLVREVVDRCWSHIERVGAEARLRESEERLRLAVEHAEVGFWDVDMIGDRLIWPRRTKELFGISADVPVSMLDFYQGLHPDDRDATSAAFAAATDPALRAVYDVEYRTVGKEDRVVRWVAAKGKGVFDELGRCVRVTGTAIEITARKQAEAALKDLNATLEARVASAVQEREQAQEALRQSQKMEAMGQLTGGVAHDFNNLLTPIVGTLDMLQRRGLGGEREQRLIAGAVQSADRAKTLVQRLLAFARRQPLQTVAVDLTVLVGGMAELVASTTGPQIRVVVDVPNDTPAVRADPNQLEMALLNLSVNARDAMPDGGTLRISARTEDVSSIDRPGLQAGVYVRLSVSDDGLGMDPVTLARAVEPFFSTKGVGKGTGLGLSMVHGLASQLGGGLFIQSRLGLGTNVELWLPRSDAAAAIASETPALASPSSPRGKVLLIDDEEVVRDSTAAMLIDLGFAVIEAASAEEATLRIERDPVDLVITDHLMTGMTGTQFAQQLRNTHPHIPLLLVSGYADLDGVDSSISRLVKPFRRDELEASIASLFSVRDEA
ncbi:GAF domain-containing protein [Sphingomonas sp.]|uniref:GAF domain-containing protein n=1 Tax=Sphingomonas sp. TaxID=28214 RepID=UPI002FDA47AF